MAKNYLTMENTQDPVILREMEALGYSSETVGLLRLSPLVRIAWAEGFVTEEEATRIFDVARRRGIVEHSPAWKQLTDWLTRRPAEEFFERSFYLIARLLQAMPDRQRKLIRTRLISDCIRTAKASDGMGKATSNISELEFERLDQLVAKLCDVSWKEMATPTDATSCDSQA